MLDHLESRLAELASRAGLKAVPPRLVLLTIVLGLLMVIWAGARWWPGGESGDAGFVRATTPEAATPLSEEHSETADEASATVLVHVVGSVRRPGVYELPQGSRAVDAVDAAGGVLPDAVPSAINLARTVSDGEQVAVPSEDDAQQPSFAGPGVSEAAALGSTGPIDLNSADATALETLPGIGPATAQKILADRETNGPYSSVDDLGRVSGIGPKRLDALRDLVCVR